MIKFDPGNPQHVAAASATPIGWAWATGRGKFQLPRHLRLWNEMALELLVGALRLLLEAPVRHGKSEWWARSVAGWFLGRNPDKRVVVASYAVSLPQRISRMAREDMAEFGPVVFGGGVSNVSGSATDWSVDGHLGGGFFVVGVGGALMGRGADLLILDDLLDQEGALSPVQRENTWNWLQGSAMRRLEPGASVVGISTRYHANDMHGRLLESDPQGWRHVNLPALARDNDLLGREPGEALWPERYDKGALLHLKETIPAYWYAALYDGNPIPEGGGIFKPAWWEGVRWTREREGDPMRCGEERVIPSDLFRYAVVDLAASEKTHADYTVVGVFGLSRTGRLYVLDWLRVRVDGPSMIRAIKAKVAEHDLPVVWMEDVATQLLQIQHARADGIPVRCYGRKAEHALQMPGDKSAVYYAATPFVERGLLSLPRSAPWLADLEAELGTVPHTADGHDDQADVIATACLLAQRGLVGRPSLTLAGAGVGTRPRSAFRRDGAVEDEEAWEASLTRDPYAPRG